MLIEIIKWIVALAGFGTVVFIFGYHFGMEAMRKQYSRRQSIFWGRMKKVARGDFAQHGFRK